MITFLQHELIDKKRWDACIHLALNGNLNGYSWFLDIVSPGWCALIEGEYDFVFPLTVWSKAGIKYIMQPYFTQQLGLYYKSAPTQSKLEEFIDSIPKEFKYIDINLNTSNRISPGENVYEMTNLEMKLNEDYKEIAAAYHPNLKRNLKKVAQNYLSREKIENIDEIISLFQSNKGKELKHLGEEQYNLIRQIANSSKERNIGEIWGAYDKNQELLAGILWVTSHHKTIFLFSALSQEGKQQYAMPWLIDTFIKENSGKNLTLDFEGSNDGGLARFYASFGSEKVIYHRYVQNTLPYLLNTGLKLLRKSRNILK